MSKCYDCGWLLKLDGYYFCPRNIRRVSLTDDACICFKKKENMNKKETINLIRELSLSLARQEIINPFMIELADLLEKYNIKLDTCKNLEIMDEYENYIFTFSVRYITHEYLRRESNI